MSVVDVRLADLTLEKTQFSLDVAYVGTYGSK